MLRAACSVSKTGAGGLGAHLQCRSLRREQAREEREGLPLLRQQRAVPPTESGVRSQRLSTVESASDTASFLSAVSRAVFLKELRRA